MIKENVGLEKYNSLRIKATANNFYEPINLNELIGYLTQLQGQRVRILGGGSNILMNNKIKYNHVLYMGSCCKEINYQNDGLFEVGASNNIQNLINFAKQFDYGGIEFLYTLPAQVGGIIAMNAGRGKGQGPSISDFVLSVKVIKNGQIEEFLCSECGFDYRTSIFKDSTMPIVSVKLRLEKKKKSQIDMDVKKRIECSKKLHDLRYPNVGSVFSEYNTTLMKIVDKISKEKRKGITLSKKTINWFINKGDGSFREAKKLINRIGWIHRLFGKTFKLEVIIWEK